MRRDESVPDRNRWDMARRPIRREDYIGQITAFSLTPLVNTFFNSLKWLYVYYITNVAFCTIGSNVFHTRYLRLTL